MYILELNFTEQQIKRFSENMNSNLTKTDEQPSRNPRSLSQVVVKDILQCTYTLKY